LHVINRVFMLNVGIEAENHAMPFTSQRKILLAGPIFRLKTR
jgi:hypothetical protein